ncbi:tetratricopeptide repeat protein [Glaciecola petra]|uniref:Tetratricopeptide repeat protein n=1 Tax=Glaciecola petra TaxID=3075602 RepID=A0ABU2ZUK8_9ALTE|nr:tetratricopeptide repeat protein [Aestuariibacter sp. P117]MDT0595102.1 tetratricopeptide repeat protein [Aestuariibacter sp. P117]
MSRRNVFTVITSYAVAGWVLVQVLSIIPQAIGLPSWILTLATVLFLAFFPVIFFVSWHFDISLDGIKLTPAKDQTEPAKIGPKYWLGFTVMLVFSSILGFYGYQIAINNVSTEANFDTDREFAQSIAVLPFKDASAEGNQIHIAFGIQEEITNKLSSFAGLVVASSFSSSAYFEKYGNPVEVAKKLNVATVVAGTVRVNGDRLKVRVELLDGLNGKVIWTNSFTRQLIDIFAIEEEISRSVVNIIQDKVFEKKDIAVTSRTESSLALVLYLKAREKMRLRNTESITEARKLFEQSIALDSEYASAKVGLAQTFLLLAEGHSSFGVIDAEVATRLAKQSVEPVLARYPELPQAHAVMGRALAYELDHNQAITYFDKALELNPNYATAFIWKYLSLKAIQRFDDAYDTLTKAYELDPAYLLVSYNYAKSQYDFDNIEKARSIYTDILDLHPNSPLSHRGFAELAFSEGELAETAIQYKQALEKSPKSESYRINLISVLFQLRAPELAKRFIQSKEWDVNVLIAEQKFDEVHKIMAFKVEANPNDPWYLYEAAWYQYLYGDSQKGKAYLLQAESLFPEQELFLPPLCPPAMEIAFAHILNDDDEKAARYISGCRNLLENSIAAGQVNESLDYLGARLAILDGDYTLAKMKLKSAYDQGWREHWTAFDPLFQPIANDPQVLAIFESIEQDLVEEKRKLIQRFDD